MARQPLPPDWQSWDVHQLEEAVGEHNRHYWDENDPVISDYDYDRLIEALRQRAGDSTVLLDMGPARTPGAEVIHGQAMLSLGKVYNEEDLLNWASKFEGEVVMSPKIDGVAASIRYEKGRLSLAATRGSGTVGEDITNNVRRIKDIPNLLPESLDVEVRGEVYMPLSVFRRFEDRFANPRNTTAGALKQKDADTSASRDLHFFAYGLRGYPTDTEIHRFELLASFGFTPVEHKLLPKAEMQAGYESYVARRDDLDYEIDGVVFGANRLDEQERLGSTSHHPRHAIAYKLQGESRQTRLRDVIWSVSRTGALTPIGIVDPVTLSGASVTRVSLHNWGLVRAKNLTLNARVVAMRRGGVIPYLEAVVEPGDLEVAPPETCPACGSKVTIEGDFVSCSEPETCTARSIQALKHFADTVGIEGFGITWLEKFFDAGVLREPPDFYRLAVDDIIGFERMGEKLASNLVAEIAARRELELATFLRCLGIPDLGKTASRTLASTFKTLAAVRGATVEDLLPLPKFAEILANKVVDGLAAKAGLIEGLLLHVTVLDASIVPPPSRTLAGKSFLFTATLASMTRGEAQAMVEAQGGTNASGVSSSLSYLVKGDEGQAGSKLAKAEKAGVTVLSEREFLEMLGRAEG